MVLPRARRSASSAAPSVQRMASYPSSAFARTPIRSSRSCCSSISFRSTENTSGRRERAETLISSFTPNSETIRRIAARYPSNVFSFRLMVVSSASSVLTEINTSTLPLETAAFTACFTASSAKDRDLGSFTVQSRYRLFTERSSTVNSRPFTVSTARP